MRRSKETQQYTIGVATLIENRLSNIKYYKDTKSSIIQAINEDISIRLIDSFLKAKVVVNLSFDEEEFLKLADVSKEEKEKYYTNLDYWYTLDELQSMGAIELQ